MLRRGFSAITNAILKTPRTPPGIGASLPPPITTPPMTCCFPGMLSEVRRGYISTGAKHGEDMITVIRDTLAGNPWMSPIPA
jgi:hypothetical protein